jgi:pimeloyl-ACP methyl ester carboxylesterase
MLASQCEAFPSAKVAPWFEPHPGESLAGYGQRHAERLRDLGPLYLGGASIGGMIALEAAKHLPALGVFLIGSCRSPAAVARDLRVAERLGRHVPLAVLTSVRQHLIPLGVGRLGPMERADRDVLIDMARRTPASFVRWGTRAIMDWPGVQDSDSPVHHIHGRLDRLILASRIRADSILEDAGHVPSLTHSERVNAFIAERAPDLL